MLNELLIKKLSEQVGINTSDIQVIKDGEIYSTNEKRIGTWTDGKPLYRKTIYINNPNDTVTDYDISSLNADYLDATNIEVDYILNNIRYVFPSPYYSNDGDKFYCFRRGTIIRCRLGDTQLGGTNKVIILNLKYTKTTD